MLSNLRSRIERVKSERAEALPAAIVTGIVSSIILLGLASVTATVVTQQTNAEVSAEANTSATNIDVSLRSDSTAATAIKAVSNKSVKFHVPSATGATSNECKLITWTVNGTSLDRVLTVYSGTKTVTGQVECDPASTVVVSNKRTLSSSLEDGSKLRYFNALGRELTAPSAGTVVPVDPAAAAPSSEPAVKAAWNSTQIAKISYKFTIVAKTGNVTRTVEQSASTPLYATPEQKKDAEVQDSQVQRPAKITTASISAQPVVLGSSYTVKWNNVVCPVDTIRSYTVYQSDTPMAPQATNTLTLTQTNEAVDYVDYGVVTTCTRGKLSIASEMSNVVSADVVPPVAVVTITNQPVATAAALNSNLAASATCVGADGKTYGTPRYMVDRTVASAGGISKTGTLTSVNRAINSLFITYEGAQYQLKVTSWCVSASGTQSATNDSETSRLFTTVLNKPAVPVFIDPEQGQTYVPTVVNLTWSTVTCAPGTTLQYDMDKTIDYGETLATPGNIVTWANQTVRSVTNYEGNKVGYTVQARCVGSTSAVAPAVSAKDSTWFTTIVTAPSVARNIDNNGYFRMTWTPPARECATGVTLRYRIVQTKANNVAGQWITGATTGTSGPVPNGTQEQGHPQWAYIQTICDGVNADSGWQGTQTTAGDKWISRIDANLDGAVTYWRKFLGTAQCGYGTRPQSFSLYIAANGFNPTWGSRQPYAPDGSYVTTSRTPVAGGNTGWLNFDVNGNRNTHWIDDGNGGYRYWYDNGRSGYATKLQDGGRNISIYYYNMASFSDNVTWWWIGSCGTEFASQTSKGANNLNPGVPANRGVGDPYSRYNGTGTGFSQTATGNAAIR